MLKENNIKNNQNASEDIEEVKIWNYISVIFENYQYKFSSPQIQENAKLRSLIYGNATQYTYKIDKEVKEGQILTIRTPGDRTARVLVVNPCMLREEIKYPIDKIKPIQIIKG